MHPMNCRNGWSCSVNRQPRHHHPAPGRCHQHRRRPALPRPAIQQAFADDHEVLTDFAGALRILRSLGLDLKTYPDNEQVKQNAKAKMTGHKAKHVRHIRKHVGAVKTHKVSKVTTKHIGQATKRG